MLGSKTTESIQFGLFATNDDSIINQLLIGDILKSSIFYTKVKFSKYINIFPLPREKPTIHVLQTV